MEHDLVIADTMIAVRVRGPNGIHLDSAAPIPALRPGYLLIRVLSIALNPSDYKRCAIFDGDVPHTIGCDAAGLVVSCGEGVDQAYKLGDRVAGLCYGIKPGEPTSGAFGQYALLKGTLCMRVPPNVSDAEAATIPVGVNFSGQGASQDRSSSTLSLGYFYTRNDMGTRDRAIILIQNATALYQTLGLPLPRLGPDVSREGDPSEGPSVLIYGGATATGMMALQFARLSRCRVLTTCSPRNFQLAKALGAHEVFDYHDAEACVAAIRAATGDNLLHALDCVTAGDSLRICAGALTSRPGVARYTASLPVRDAFPRKDVRHGWTSGYVGTSFFPCRHMRSNHLFTSVPLCPMLNLRTFTLSIRRNNAFDG